MRVDPVAPKPFVPAQMPRGYQGLRYRILGTKGNEITDARLKPMREITFADIDRRIRIKKLEHASAQSSRHALRAVAEARPTSGSYNVLFQITTNALSKRNRN